MPDIDSQKKWFEEFWKTDQYEQLKERPIAYFSAEYGLAQEVPTYAGGLGILSGDTIREAADHDIPIVGVGIYYREGYSCDMKDIGGTVVETCANTPPESVGLTPVLSDDGKRLLVNVPIQDHDVVCQAWKWQDDRVVVYMLDSDIEANSPSDRAITHRLYVMDKETRFKQQIILGIGGLRLLEKIGIHPYAYHLNEGHSAMLTLELIRHQMLERELSFDEAKQFARRRVVMTNHTLVAAGNETYSNDLVALLLGKFAHELQVPVDEIVKMGLVQESSVFSMTMLALRMAGVVNAVSKLHAKKAKEIWADHPMVAVTNGVHMPTWNKIEGDVSELGAFWSAHQEHKRTFVEYLKEKAGKDWGEDEIIIGWARRIVQYKRPLAVFKDMRRLVEIARNVDMPVRFVFAGKPHPSDQEGLRMAKTLRELADTELKDFVAYLPWYDIDTAKLMVSGCDVWLNTPVVGFEACGTSGMKAAANGVLPCSTNDGWVYEADLFNVGWILDSDHISAHILDVIEKDIAPVYYDRNADGVPEEWEKMMRNARDMALNQFSATRMLRKYIRLMYF